jgi:two-component system, NarL family, sensor kinase
VKHPNSREALALLIQNQPFVLFLFAFSFLFSVLYWMMQTWFNLLLILLLLTIISIVYLLYLSQKSQKSLKTAKDMLRVQLEIQDLTFSAISHEIHDNVGQILSLAKVQLNLLSEENTQEGKLLTDAKENISNALIDLREIAKGLSNKKLISLGLLSSIQHEAHRLQETNLWEVQVAVEGNPLPVTETQHLVIFRAIQYFLNRITQMEVGSNKITITMGFYPQNWHIKIVHHRKDPDINQQLEQQYHQEQSLVLRRLSIIGGTFTVTENGETQILIQIPYA